MLLFQGFMSEAQKTWKSLMEKTYEIIPSTHRVVPCKIFSIILSKAVKIHSSKRILILLQGNSSIFQDVREDPFIPRLQSKVFIFPCLHLPPKFKS